MKKLLAFTAAIFLTALAARLLALAARLPASAERSWLLWVLKDGAGKKLGRQT